MTISKDIIWFIFNRSEWSSGWWIINGAYRKFCRDCGRVCTGSRCINCFSGTDDPKKRAAVAEDNRQRLAVKRAAKVFQLSAAAQTLGGPHDR